jgi:hypothetical protein
LGKFDGQDNPLPTIGTTPHMIKGRVKLGDAQKSIFKKNKDNYKKVLICPKKHVSLQRI